MCYTDETRYSLPPFPAIPLPGAWTDLIETNLHCGDWSNVRCPIFS